MKYPMLHNTVLLRKNADGVYKFLDMMTDNEYEVSENVYYFSKKLNGKTDPYTIETTLTKVEIKGVLSLLNENDLLRKSRVLSKTKGKILYTLFFTKSKAVDRVIALFLNLLLMVSWFPVLVLGVLFFIKTPAGQLSNGLLFGSITGMTVGIFLHEIGHMISGLAYGAHIFELGVLIQYYFMPGAYVLMNDKNIKNKLKQAQINGAGVEMNFLLCGIFLLLGAGFPNVGGVFLGAAVNNLFIGVLNLTFVNGLDGSKIISILLGDDCLLENAMGVLRDKRSRRTLWRKGIVGKGTVVACAILTATQLTLPTVYALSIVEVIRICYL